MQKGSTDPIVSDIATAMNNKASLRKKRTKSKSLQMSVKFALIREINRLTSSVMRKFENARVGSGSSTASKDRWTPLTTPAKVFKLQLYIILLQDLRPPFRYDLHSCCNC